MSEAVKVTLKLPTFDGKQSSYQNWWFRFKSYALVHGFSELLKPEKPTELGDTAEDPKHMVGPVSDPDAAPVKLTEAQRLFRLNAIAFSQLVCCFTQDNFECNAMVIMARNAAWKDGATWLLVKKLEKKYMGTDLLVEMELNQKLSNLKMDAHACPSILFGKLAEIQSWYNRPLPMSKALPALISALPKEIYKSTATSFGLSCNNQGDLFDELETLETQLVAYWRSFTGGKSSGKDIKSDELSMSSFTGHCYKCKATGHKASDCPKKTDGPKFSGNCHLCGLTGHRKSDCWEDPANASKRPKTWKSKGSPDKKPSESGKGSGKGSEAGGVHIEMLMCGIIFDEDVGAVEVPVKSSALSVRPRIIVDDDDEDDDPCLAIGPNNQPCKYELLGDDVIDADEEVKTVDPPVEYLFPAFNVPTTFEILNDPDIWLVDSGASVHSTPHDIGFVEHVVSKDSVVVGSGESLAASKVGAIRGVWCSRSGQELFSAKIANVIHLPGARYNLLSLTQFLKNDWSLSGGKDFMQIQKDGRNLTFDIIIPTGRGVLFAVYFKRLSGAETAHFSSDVNFWHKKFGHSCEDSTRKTAAALGIQLTGTMKPCTSCSITKAKQKAVSKFNATHELATVDNLRIFLDLAWFKTPKGGPRLTNRYWRLIVDERTQLKFTDFFNTKNGMVVPTVQKLYDWNKAGLHVKYVRCDNAGENRLLESTANGVDWKLSLQMEYTARDTPQHNHLVERAFPTIAARAKALMVDANVPLSQRYLLFRSAVVLATMLDGLIVQCVGGLSATRFVHFFGRNPNWSKYLRTYGEAGTVKIASDTSSKLADRGVPCLFIGYARNHAGDTYLMYDPDTQRVHTTRDVIWLKRFYFEKVPNPPDVGGEPLILVVDSGNTDEKHTNNQTDDDSTDDGLNIGSAVQDADAADIGDDKYDDDDDEEAEEDEDEEDSDKDEEENTSVSSKESKGSTSVSFNNRYRLLMDDDEDDEEEDEAENGDQSAPPKTTPKPYVTRSGRTVKPPKTADELGLAEFDLLLSEFSCVGSGIGGGFETTDELKVLNYKQAMASKDKVKWKGAVEEEHHRMVKNKVWKAVSRRHIPCGAKFITSTWAMKHKANGVFRARLVARGFQQTEGEHFDENSISSPVVSDVTIRIVLVLMLIFNWYGIILDINGAFLLGRFSNGEMIYMIIPDGFQEFYKPDEVLLLLRTLYGLKQAAHAFYKELLEALNDTGFVRSAADPCLYYKSMGSNFSDMVLIISWIDDLLIVGNKSNVEKTRQEILRRFDCDDVGELNEYVGCKIERTNERIKVTQPVLIQSLIDEFDTDPNAHPSTPAEPGQVLVKSAQVLNGDQQKTYRSGVGKLLHIMRWSRPDILNAVRELSKFMMAASLAHFKAMIRVMEYLIGSSTKGLVLKPVKSEFLEIVGVTDANYATDTDSRKSVSGFSVFINGAPVSFKSVQQQVITLSTTEAELYAITQGAQEMLFVLKIVESLGMEVKKPMSLYCDNRGAVILTNNYSIGGRTRHIETRQFFMRDLKDLKLILCMWRAGKEISSDMFTKNLDRATFEVHLSVYVDE